MSRLTDAQIGAYYDRHQAHLAAGLPDDGRAHLRRHYIDGVRQNPEAQRQILDALSREWHESRRRNNERHQRISDFISEAVAARRPMHDWRTHDLLGPVAEVAEALQRIVERDAHPDDVDHAQAGLGSLALLWLSNDEVEALWLGGDDPSTL